MAAFSDYLENVLVDWLFRAQALPTLPANLSVALFTGAPTEAGGGTEVSATGTNYARASIARSLAAWAGTQAAGSTAASTGNTGTTSNNGAITFNAPGATAWGSITHVAVMDAATGGNVLLYAALTTPKTVNANDAAPSFAVGQMQWQMDN